MVYTFIAIILTVIAYFFGLMMERFNLGNLSILFAICIMGGFIIYAIKNKSNNDKKE